jgi:hypothetical protein
MRLSLAGFIIIALALGGLASSAVGAQSTRTKVDYGPTCACEFGYGGNACVAAIACGIEGGRCSKPCVPPEDNQAAH